MADGSSEWRIVVDLEPCLGRYHAHPWGAAQHALGEPEWPPSPWRLLRALAAAAFRICGANGSGDVDGDYKNVIEILGKASEIRIRVPRACFRETRFYQPTTVEGGAERRRLHFDHFALLDEPRRIEFVFVLSGGEADREANNGQLEKPLSKLLAAVPYFGRSESRAILRLWEAGGGDDPPPPFECRELRGNGQEDAGGEGEESLLPRMVLVPDRESFDFQSLYSLKGVRKGGAGSQGGGQQQAQNNSETRDRESLVDQCLREGVAVPGGARWAVYGLPREAVVTEFRASGGRRPSEAGGLAKARIELLLLSRAPIGFRAGPWVLRALRLALLGRLAVHRLLEAILEGERAPAPADVGPPLAESLLAKLPDAEGKPAEGAFAKDLSEALEALRKWLSSRSSPSAESAASSSPGGTDETSRRFSEAWSPFVARRTRLDWKGLLPELRATLRRAASEAVDRLVTSALRDSGEGAAAGTGPAAAIGGLLGDVIVVPGGDGKAAWRGGAATRDLTALSTGKGGPQETIRLGGVTVDLRLDCDQSGREVIGATVTVHTGDGTGAAARAADRSSAWTVADLLDAALALDRLPWGWPQPLVLATSVSR